MKRKKEKRILLNDPTLVDKRLAHLEQFTQEQAAENKRLTGLVQDLELKITTMQQGFKGNGATSTRWGKESCPSNTSLVYSAALSCPTATGISNSQDFNQQFPVGFTRTAVCTLGYEAAGSLEITCQANQKWSSASGYCRKLLCGKPRLTDMVNVIRIQGVSYFYKDQIRYQCRAVIPPMKNPPVITCNATGQWDDAIACNMPCKGGCRNGGICLGYLGCKCPPGYGGKRCERAICILPCLHRGRCIAPYQCACTSGYTGSRCQSAVCDPPCENRGICEKPNVCHCQHGFKGHLCESSDLRTFERAERARESTTSSTTVSPGWSWS